MSVPKLQLVDLRKEFADGSVAAVEGVDLSVAPGETLALLGPSGCGKSTTLNMIVGLEEPTGGDILIDGRSVVGVPPGRRNVGLVFQDYAVFTSMTVRKNLAFGLAVRGRPRAEVARAVAEVAELLGMADKLDARASDLGGSELQRVAIGRTLVTRPAILLLDEPLSNLDAAARLATRRELRRLQKEIGLTIVYVTHDQIEALSLADRVAVMSAGRIQQVQLTSLICERPDTVFVAGFLGSPPMNLLRGDLLAADGAVVFRRGDFRLRLDGEAGRARAGAGPVVLGLPPHGLGVVRPGAGSLAGTVVAVELRGSETVLAVESGGAILKVLTAAGRRVAEGDAVGLAVDPAGLLVFSGETGRRIAA